jgi:hypothetical protein
VTKAVTTGQQLYWQELLAAAQQLHPSTPIRQLSHELFVKEPLLQCLEVHTFGTPAAGGASSSRVNAMLDSAFQKQELIQVNALATASRSNASEGSYCSSTLSQLSSHASMAICRYLATVVLKGPPNTTRPTPHPSNELQPPLNKRELLLSQINTCSVLSGGRRSQHGTAASVYTLTSTMLCQHPYSLSINRTPAPIQTTHACHFSFTTASRRPHLLTQPCPTWPSCTPAQPRHVLQLGSITIKVAPEAGNPYSGFTLQLITAQPVPPEQAVIMHGESRLSAWQSRQQPITAEISTKAGRPQHHARGQGEPQGSGRSRRKGARRSAAAAKRCCCRWQPGSSGLALPKQGQSRRRSSSRPLPYGTSASAGTGGFTRLEPECPVLNRAQQGAEGTSDPRLHERARTVGCLRRLRLRAVHWRAVGATTRQISPGRRT